MDAWAHSSAALFAAATARSTTSGVAIGTLATTWPVADSVTSVWRSAAAASGAPPIQWLSVAVDTEQSCLEAARKIVDVSAPAPDPDSVEHTLLDRRADLRAQVARLTKAPERGSGISFGKRVGDGTIEAVARLSDVSVVDSLNVSIEQVEHALEQLAAGSYGTCESCGTTIPAARMQARPESTMCVECSAAPRQGAGT